MESAWREMLRFGGMTSKKVRDKDIAGLDRNGLKRMCVRMWKSDGYCADNCILSRRVRTVGFI